MASDYDYLPVSNGSGDAALMHINGSGRLTGSSVIPVDSVANVPSKFIATAGTLLASGLIDPSTAINFKGHTSGSTLVIDAYEPGSTDAGNTAGQVVVIKPNTGWANRIAQFIKNSTGFGTPEAVTFAAITAVSATLSAALSAASAAISGALTVGGNLTVTGQSRVVPVVIASAATITPSAQIYDVTAQAATATIAAPSFTAANGLAGVLRIKDNGTPQAISFASGYTNVSGVDTPTTTVASKLLTIGYIYNSAPSKWQIVSISTEA